MRYSKSFIPTLREDPAEARKTPSHRLLLRSGYVRQVGAGIYEFLPLGLRVLKKIENIVRAPVETSYRTEESMPIMRPITLSFLDASLALFLKNSPIESGSVFLKTRFLVSHTQTG